MANVHNTFKSNEYLYYGMIWIQLYHIYTEMKSE